MLRSRPRTLLAALLALALTLGVGANALAQKIDDSSPKLPDTNQPERVTPSDRDTPVKSVDRAKIKKRLLFLLAGYHYFPDRPTLDKLASPKLIADLGAEIAMETSLRNSTRMRAVALLGLYDDPKTLELLKKLATEDTSALPAAEQRPRGLMQHHAITALAKSQKDKALPTIAPLLQHKNLQIKLTAISALGKHAGTKARANLKSLRAKDNHPRVQRELRKYLRD